MIVPFASATKAAEEGEEEEEKVCDGQPVWVYAEK